MIEVINWYEIFKKYCLCILELYTKFKGFKFWVKNVVNSWNQGCLEIKAVMKTNVRKYGSCRVLLLWLQEFDSIF